MTELIVALDVDDLATARTLTAAGGEAVGWYKIGSHLFTRCGPAAVRMLKEADISNTVAKDVFELMLDEGGSPAAIVDRLGLRQIRDPDQLSTVLGTVLAEEAENVALYRGGRTQVLGYLIGRVMKASGGKADPKLVRELVVRELERSSGSC